MVADEKGLVGSEAVIDKDLSCALLAEVLNADHLVVTDADAIYQNWERHSKVQFALQRLKNWHRWPWQTVAMGPKIMAVSRFVNRSGKVAHIGGLKDIDAVLAGTAGTLVTR